MYTYQFCKKRESQNGRKYNRKNHKITLYRPEVDKLEQLICQLCPICSGVPLPARACTYDVELGNQWNKMQIIVLKGSNIASGDTLPYYHKLTLSCIFWRQLCQQPGGVSRITSRLLQRLEFLPWRIVASHCYHGIVTISCSANRD